MLRRLFVSSFLLFCCLSSVAQITPAPTEPQPKAEPLTALERYRNSRIGIYMNDFGQLARYREANAALQPPAPGEKRVVFFGDSITDGWKLADYFAAKPYINRGISGQTTPQMLVRFREDVINLQPKAVVILAGTNDIAGNTGPMSLEEIEANYSSLAELAVRFRFEPPVLVVGPGGSGSVQVAVSATGPDPGQDASRALTVSSDFYFYSLGAQFWIQQDTDGGPESLANQLKQWGFHNDTGIDLSSEQSGRVPSPAWLKGYCAAHGCVYLDYFSAMIDEKGLLKKELADDGLHPNPAGYKVMAPLAEAAITQALSGSVR